MILLLSLIFMLEFYVWFCGQRFLETGEVLEHGTNSIECRGPVRVANHKGFYFYRWFSDWKFMSTSGVNVFSKRARFHDLGPISSTEGDQQGWTIIKDFVSIINFHAGNLCLNMWSAFSRNRRGLRTRDQFHRIRDICKSDQLYRVLLLPLIFKLEVYVQFCD